MNFEASVACVWPLFNLHCPIYSTHPTSPQEERGGWEAEPLVYIYNICEQKYHNIIQLLFKIEKINPPLFLQKFHFRNLKLLSNFVYFHALLMKLKHLKFGSKQYRFLYTNITAFTRQNTTSMIYVKYLKLLLTRSQIFCNVSAAFSQHWPDVANI